MDVLDRLFRRLVHNVRATHPQYLTESFEVGELFQTLVPYRHNRADLGIEMNQDYEQALMRLLAGERGYLLGDAIMQSALASELASSNPDTTRYREFASSRVSLSADAASRVEPGGAPTPRSSLGDAAGAMQQAAAGVSAAVQAEPTGLAGRPSLASTGVMPTVALADGAAEPPAGARPSGGQRAGAEAAFPDPSAFGFPLRTPTPSSAPRASVGVGGAPAPAPTSAAPPPTAVLASQSAGIVAEGTCRYCSGTLPGGRRITYCPHCGQNLTVRQCPACSTELEVGWRFCVTCGRQDG